MAAVRYLPCRQQSYFVDFAGSLLASLSPPAERSRRENQNMKTPRLGRRVMRAIGRQLRELYADIIADGVPERFSAILRRLDDPNTQDEPPAAPSSAEQRASRDDGQTDGGDTHESRVPAHQRSMRRLAAVLIRVLASLPTWSEGLAAA